MYDTLGKMQDLFLYKNRIGSIHARMTAFAQNISRGRVHILSQNGNTFLDSVFSDPSTEVLGYQMHVRVPSKIFREVLTLDLDGNS